MGTPLEKTSIKLVSKCLEIRLPVGLKYSLSELFRSRFSTLNTHKQLACAVLWGFMTMAGHFVGVTCRQIC